MKKAILILILVCCTAPGFSQSKREVFDPKISKARLNFGIRGGINFNSFGPDISHAWDNDLEQKSDLGWNVGIVFDCPILESFYFQPGAFYKTRGFNFSETNPMYSRHISGSPNWLMFPLLFSYRYQIKKGMQLEFNLGPYIGVGIGGSVRDVVFNHSGWEEGGDDETGFEPGGLNPDYVDPKKAEVVERKFFGSDLEESFGISKSDFGLVIGTGLTINRFYVGFQYDLGLTNLRDDSCWAENVRFRNGAATILVGINFNK